MSNDKPLALITGVGPGTGTALVKRYAEGGYRVAMMARNADRLRSLEQEVEGSIALPCDVTDPDAVAAAVAKVGAPKVLVHNAVGGAFGTWKQIEPETLRQNFETNTMALFTLAQLIAPAMVDAGEGAIIITGNTSALRGKPMFTGFAPSKAAQRILAESLARDLGPKGVHVAYLIIDAVIDVAWARQRYADKGDEFFISPGSIAAEVFHLSQQPKDAWSFLAEVRPYAEAW